MLHRDLHKNEQNVNSATQINLKVPAFFLVSIKNTQVHD